MKEKDKERYSRHIALPQIGEIGQAKINASKILVVGAGGLGSPILLYLVAAGVGTIGIVDDDVVSLSNLQRQVLYKEKQCGELKTDKAFEALKDINDNVKFNIYNIKIDDSNAEKIISEYDVVIGATDNITSRFCIDKNSKRLKIPFIHGSICEFQGQVSVFNYNGGPSYSDLFAEAPKENSQPIGVLGVLPGIIGSMQACEAIKIILQQGNILSGKLLVYDALKVEATIIEF